MSVFKELLTFRRMITPGVVQLLFVVLSVIWVVAIIFLMLFDGARHHLLPGIGSIILGLLALRIILEGVVVRFRIYDTLSAIQKGVDKDRHC